MPVLGYITLTVTISREGREWVGVCQELGVSTFDESLDTLFDEIKVLITQHLNALERNGARADFFKKHGIRLRSTSPSTERAHNLPVRSGTLVTRLIQSVPLMAHA